MSSKTSLLLAVISIMICSRCGFETDNPQWIGDEKVCIYCLRKHYRDQAVKKNLDDKAQAGLV